LLKDKNLNRKTLASLTLAATAVGALGAAGSAQAAGTLTGAGSTLVAPLVAQWQSALGSKGTLNLTYGAVGSGTGIADVTARSVDFGASDAPLTVTQAQACNACVQIPWGLTATAIAYRIDGVGALKLTPALLTAIYLGQIGNWNNPAIAKVNKGVTLPNLKITPVFRSDGSGDTYAFTDWLSKATKTFNLGVATQVAWPTGFGSVGAKGNAGEASVVSATNGAISYISASYLIANKLKGAALQNKAGKFEYANLANIKAAAAVVKKVPKNNELHIVNPPKTAKKAYPLSTFTYAIVPKTGPNNALVKTLVNYAVTTGQSFGPALDFAPLPKIVVKAAEKTAASLN
jgi:phosphate transport system substrate-binding protein